MTALIHSQLWVHQSNNVSDFDLIDMWSADDDWYLMNNRYESTMLAYIFTRNI